MTLSWIPLLVPEEHYVELATIVASRMGELGHKTTSTSAIEIRLAGPAEGRSATLATDGGATAAAAALDTHRVWSVENLARLIANQTATAQRWVMAIDVCMNHIGEFVSTQQIVDESGMTLNVWRDACRKMTTHQRANYADETMWPLAGESGRALGHSYDQLYVAITPEQAERWAAAKGSTL